MDLPTPQPLIAFRPTWGKCTVFVAWTGANSRPAAPLAAKKALSVARSVGSAEDG